MIDRVKPLKIENSATGGTQIDPYPTETNPLQDYIAVKGIAFENLDTFLIEKLGRTLSLQTPDDSQATTYLANGEVDYVEYYSSASQITTNRIAKVTIGYDGSLNPTSETWLIYNTNGTTVLRTITLTHSFTGVDLTNTVQVTS